MYIRIARYKLFRVTNIHTLEYAFKTQRRHLHFPHLSFRSCRSVQSLNYPVHKYQSPCAPLRLFLFFAVAIAATDRYCSAFLLHLRLTSPSLPKVAATHGSPEAEDQNSLALVCTSTEQLSRRTVPGNLA